MKRNFFKSMLLTGMLFAALGFSTVVSAEQTAPVEVGWHVDYKAGATGNVLDDSSFNADEVDAKLGSMQPGDRVIFTITLNNQKQAATRWYMENEVMRSMERLATDTGAYTYKLTYNGEIINNAEETGGANDSEEAVGGMKPATAGLENFFELGSIAAGGSGTVKLEIELEGESQGNSYQNAQARLRFHFAVDETGTAPTPTVTPAPGRTTTTGTVGTIVKTGDEFHKLKYLTALAAAGVVLLFLAVIATKKRRAEEAADEREEQKGGR